MCVAYISLSIEDILQYPLHKIQNKKNVKKTINNI